MLKARHSRAQFWIAETSTKNLPHPEAQVRDRCGQKQVDRITDLPIEEVSPQAEVPLQMPDPWFDRLSPAKSRFRLSFLVDCGVLLRSVGSHNLGCATVRFASKSSVADGHCWPVS